MKLIWQISVGVFSCVLLSLTGMAQDSLSITNIDKHPNSIGLKYDFSFFDQEMRKPWHLVSTEYIRKLKNSSLIGRLNYAHRFGNSAVQTEVETYPKINKKIYSYLNVGLSGNKLLFPKFKSGASIYITLPAKFEVEAGARYLNFNKPIFIYTAALGKYYKQYWFNASTFISPQNSAISTSFLVRSRYYFNDTDFVMLLLASGLSPDSRVDNTLFNTFLKSRKAELSLRRSLHDRYTIFINSSVNFQQVQNDKFIRQYNIGTGLQLRF